MFRVSLRSHLLRSIHLSVRRFEHPRETRGLLLGLLLLQELVELGEAVGHVLVDVGVGIGVGEETFFFGGHGVDDGDGVGRADLLIEGFAAGGSVDQGEGDADGVGGIGGP